MVKGRCLVIADGATSRLATELGYCTEPPKGVCSRAFVEGGTHNTNFDGRNLVVAHETCRHCPLQDVPLLCFKIGFCTIFLLPESAMQPTQNIDLQHSEDVSPAVFLSVEDVYPETGQVEAINRAASCQVYAFIRGSRCPDIQQSLGIPMMSLTFATT